ncbi:Uncharacterised protein [Phocoenobacter uteri]|uniref:Lipoprotein n=2 Tax=Phocoenobacter uteri TaxID=146806 RepID=A0A379CB26_9PAST|nr:hypothetical protein [Phocoenobacter uteri]SUB59592.1 Uncharacterised protein [Phocoenobacter uteri]
MKRKAIPLLVLSALLLSACTTRVADLTVASSKNMNLNSTKLAYGKRVQGIHQSASIANMKEAMDRAIEQDRCVVGLSDVVISVKQGFFTVGYVVKGTQIIDRSLPGCSNR